MRQKFEHPVLLAALGAAGLLMGAFNRSAPGADASPSAPGQGRAPQGPGQAGDDGRGREAAKPSDIPPRGWWDIVKRVAGQVSADRVMTEAAAVTFFALLSIFPALAALISLYGLVADPKIRFKLATRDPDGKRTDGVVRVQTDRASFGPGDAVKRASQGGSPAWPTDRYLNIWVCTLGGGLRVGQAVPDGVAEIPTRTTMRLGAAFAVSYRVNAPF